MENDAPDAHSGEPPPESGPQSEIAVYTCPDCLETVAVDPVERGPFIVCPYCSGEFAIAAFPDEEEAAALEKTEADRSAREAELDGMRIKQLSTARRAEIRTQTYMFVGILGSVCGIAWLGAEGVTRVRSTHAVDLRLLAILLSGMVFLMLLVFCLRQWIAVGKKLKESALGEPETPPDFTGLGDGSEHWKKLDEIE